MPAKIFRMNCWMNTAIVLLSIACQFATLAGAAAADGVLRLSHQG
jgi:hypothetical protein